MGQFLIGHNCVEHEHYTDLKNVNKFKALRDKLWKSSSCCSEIFLSISKNEKSDKLIPPKNKYSSAVSKSKVH